MVGISSFATKQKQHIYWCLASITSHCRGAGTGWRRWLAGAGSMQPSIVIVMALSWIFQIVCGAVCIITLYRTGPYNSGGGAHALLITPCLVIVMLHIINTLSTADLPRTGDTWQHRTQEHNQGEKTGVKKSVSYEAIRKLRLFVTFSLLARPSVCGLLRCWRLGWEVVTMSG